MAMCFDLCLIDIATVSERHKLSSFQFLSQPHHETHFYLKFGFQESYRCSTGILVDLFKPKFGSEIVETF